MREDSKKFLFEYLSNTAPTGFETSGQRLWLDYVGPYCDTHLTDTYGSVVAVVNPEATYKVVIEAHADEISWFVNYISPEGYLYVRQNGGSDAMIAPSMRVHVHTDEGPIKGVFGWPAIHVRETKDDKPPKVEDLFIDLGCDNRDEVLARGVHVGCVVTFADGPDELNDRFLIGRALDNRIGGFMIAEVLRRLHEANFRPDFGLYVVNAVQEEIGLRGAEMISRRLRPDVALITDVCHDTSPPMYNKIKSGEQQAGKGPVLTYGPAVQRNLLRRVIETAEQAQIPFQRAAATRATGTDTDAFAYSGEGVASALISLPLRYMHTTVETVHYADVEHVIELMHKFLVNLPAGHDFRYLS